jgi:hypothetical protein
MGTESVLRSLKFPLFFSFSLLFSPFFSQHFAEVTAWKNKGGCGVPGRYNGGYFVFYYKLILIEANR